MKFRIPKCPECGAPAGAIIEQAIVTMYLDDPDEDGEQDYNGVRNDGDPEPVPGSDEDPESLLLQCSARDCDGQWTSHLEPTPAVSP